MKAKKLESAVRKMPRLSHWPDKTKPFRYQDSEVVNWIIKQPEVMEYIFEKVRQAGVIEYDKKSGKWIGASKAKK